MLMMMALLIVGYFVWDGAVDIFSFSFSSLPLIFIVLEGHDCIALLF